MLYREIGTTGVKASCVAFGTWELAGNVWGAVSEADAVETIRAALDGGVSMIDTAASYGGGRSEELVGKALAGIRAQVVLVTKGGAHFNPQKNCMERDLTPAALRRDVEDSLRRLQTDYIDLFFCHYPDPDHPVEETMAGLEELRKEGKIRMIGLSNYSQEEMAEAVKYGTVDCAQFRYSMLTRENEELRGFCERNRIGILSYASLAGGMLSGIYKTEPQFEEGDRRTFFYPFLKEPEFSRCRKLVDVVEQTAEANGILAADAAIQWVIAQPGMTSALVGSKNPERAKRNGQAFERMLSAEELAHFDEVYREIFGG